MAKSFQTKIQEGLDSLEQKIIDLEFDKLAYGEIDKNTKLTLKMWGAIHAIGVCSGLKMIIRMLKEKRNHL